MRSQNITMAKLDLSEIRNDRKRSWVVRMLTLSLIAMPLSVCAQPDLTGAFSSLRTQVVSAATVMRLAAASQTPIKSQAGTGRHAVITGFGGSFRIKGKVAPPFNGAVFAAWGIARHPRWGLLEYIEVSSANEVMVLGVAGEEIRYVALFLVEYGATIPFEIFDVDVNGRASTRDMPADAQRDLQKKWDKIKPVASSSIEFVRSRFNVMTKEELVSFLSHHKPDPNQQ